VVEIGLHKALVTDEGPAFLEGCGALNTLGVGGSPSPAASSRTSNRAEN
jgi:hypothetical protein